MKDSSAIDFASSEDDVALRRKISPISAGAMLVVGLAGGCAVAMLPGVLSAFVGSGEVTASQSPGLGAAELTGITVAMFESGFLLSKFGRWRVAFFSVVAIILGQLISAWVHAIGFLFMTRVCVGLFEGVVIATVTTGISSTTMPERLFALWLSMCLIVSTAFYAALPLILSLGQLKGVTYALSGLAVIAASALPWFPRDASVDSTVQTKVQRPARYHDLAVPAILALSASLMLFVGIGAVWPVVPQIGRSNHVDVATVSGALSAASFAGVVSGLFTSWLGLRVGRMIPIIVGTVGLSLTMLLLLMTGVSVFVFATIIFLALWLVNCTYYLGVVAALDPSGRLATITFAAQFLGLTFGQFLSTALLQAGFSYHQLIIMCATLALLALLQIILAMRSGVSHART